MDIPFVIEIRHLAKEIRSQGKFFSSSKLSILKDITLSVSRGEILGIIGPNGAGKSTLVKHVLGLTRPSSGTVHIFGITADKAEARQSIGYLPENPYYYDHLTPEELLSFGLCHSPLGAKERTRRIEECLVAVGMEHAARKRLRSFSKGMVQRTGLALALVADPEILVLDEPMSGLDPIGRKRVADLILDMKAKGKTILFCSHILNDVERMSDRVVLMHDGALQKELNRAEMAALPLNLRVFLSDRLPDDNKFTTCGNPESGFWVRCETENLPVLVSLCTTSGIRIEGMDMAESSLEKVFYEMVEEKTPSQNLETGRPL